MKNSKIIHRVACFSWLRVPFNFLAIAFVIFVQFVSLSLAELRGSFPFLFVLLDGVVSVYGCSVIANFSKKRYTTAQVAMITRAIYTGELPKHVFREGMRVMQKVFKSSSLTQLARRGAYIAALRVIRHETSSEINKQRGRTFLSDIIAVVVLYIGNLLPYIGICAMGWEFANPGGGMVKTVCDALEAFFKNFWRMLGRCLAESFLCLLLAVLTFRMVFDITYHAVASNAAAGLAVSDFLLTYMPRLANGPDEFYSLVMVSSLAAELAVLILWPKFIECAHVRVLRTYFNVAETNPPTGSLYERVSHGNGKEAGTDEAAQPAGNSGIQNAFKLSFNPMMN